MKVAKPSQSWVQTTATDLLKDGRYMDAVAKSCERLDRILTGSSKVSVNISPARADGVPAYQQHDDLYLVPSNIRTMVSDPTDEEEVLPVVVGLDLHEMGHFEFSPRPDNDVWQKTLNTSGNAKDWDDYRKTLRFVNILEDQRQELLMTTRYPRARDYFRLIVLKSMFKVNNRPGGIPPENWLLYYGRRHMVPRPILNRLEAQMAAKYGAQTVAECKSLIDEYLTLNSAGQDEAALTRMWNIASDFKRRFEKTEPEDMREPCYEQSRFGGRAGKRGQEKAIKDAAEVLKQVDEQIKQRNEKDEQDAKDAANGSKADPNDPSDTDTDEDSDSADTDDSGDELSDALRKLISTSYGKLAGETGDRANEIRVQMFAGPAQRLARHLRTIATDLKETDHSRIRSGKLDIRRVPAAISANDSQIFRRRQESLESEAAMGIHVMVDVSGSMTNNIKTAVDAAATIAQAAELAGHHVKVSTFSSYDTTIKNWDDAAMRHNRLGYGGGTNPLNLLTGASTDFKKAGSQYRFRNFAIILVTDGEFDDPEGCAAQFTKMHNAGVSILLVGINQAVAGYGGRSTYDGAGNYVRTDQREYSADGKVTIKDVTELESKMRGYLKKIALNIARRVVAANS